MPGILITVDDLFFLSKIQQTSRLLGIPIETVAPDKLQDRLAQGPEGSIIIDLNHRSGLSVETVRAIKSNPATRTVPILGFLSHIQADLAQAARAAGCDIVLARSAFSQQLPEWMQELAARGASTASS